MPRTIQQSVRLPAPADELFDSYLDPRRHADLVHVNVADHDFEDVSKGWEKYYWAPWRKFLGQA